MTEMMNELYTPSAPSESLWVDGWYRFARHISSPNFGPRPGHTPIDLVVLHSISLPPGIYGGAQVAELFTNQLDWNAHPYFESIRGLQVSSHFYIQRHGELWQFVSCESRAWHAGTSFYRGRSNCNDDSIGIELEGLEGENFEESQYETMEILISALAGRYPIEHIAGHEHIAQGRKQDPGPGLDWKALQRALGLPNACFPTVTNK